MTRQLVSDDYDRLKGEVVRLLQEGKSLVEQAIIQETLRTYHGIGRVLDHYLLAQKDRAEYGEQTGTVLQL